MRLIDADEIIKWADDSVSQYGGTYSTDMLNMFGLFKHIIDNAPTIDGEILTKEAYSDLCLRASQARPQGEWKKIKRKLEDGRHSKFIFRCPFCEYVEGYEANFCGKCGADLRGGES